MAQNATLRLTVTSLTLCLMQVTSAGQSGQGAPKTKVRLNKIIEQFEQGQPAYVNEHWQFISIEHTLLFDDYAKALASLQPAKGEVRPRLAPVVRIVPSADEPFKSAVKQVLDDGAFGVVLPDVKTKEEVMRFVSAMRYPQQPGSKYPRPEGVRGCPRSGGRAHRTIRSLSFTGGGQSRARCQIACGRAGHGDRRQGVCRAEKAVWHLWLAEYRGRACAGLQADPVRAAQVALGPSAPISVGSVIQVESRRYGRFSGAAPAS